MAQRRTVQSTHPKRASDRLNIAPPGSLRHGPVWWGLNFGFATAATDRFLGMGLQVATGARYISSRQQQQKQQKTVCVAGTRTKEKNKKWPNMRVLAQSV